MSSSDQDDKKNGPISDSFAKKLREEYPDYFPPPKANISFEVAETLQKLGWAAPVK